METKKERLPTSAEVADQTYRALLDVSELIISHRDLESLFHDLAERLHQVVRFAFASLVLYDPAKNVMRLHVLETQKSTTLTVGSEFPVAESPTGLAWQTQQPVVVPDIGRETRFPQLMAIAREHGITSACWLPLTTSLRRLGAVAFGTDTGGPYSEDELEFMRQVARQVAVAVDNARHHRDAQSYQQQLLRERDRLDLILDINNFLASNLDLQQLAGERAGAGELHRAVGDPVAWARAARAAGRTAIGGEGAGHGRPGRRQRGGDPAGGRRAGAYPAGAAGDPLGDQRAGGGGGAPGAEADDADVAYA